LAIVRVPLAGNNRVPAEDLRPEKRAHVACAGVRVEAKEKRITDAPRRSPVAEK
jgi:hypothetical protein